MIGAKLASPPTCATQAALSSGTPVRSINTSSAWAWRFCDRRKAWRIVRRQSRESPHAEVPDQSIDQLPWEDIATLHDALLQLANRALDVVVVGGGSLTCALVEDSEAGGGL